MEDIVILPADKGNVTVVLDRQEYQEKVDQMLKDPETYKPITRDPSNKTEKVVRQSIKTQEANIKVNLSNTRLSRFVGYPKIHKEGVPLRPVIDSRESATYDLAKRLTRTIQPIIGKTEHHVKNSSHLVDMLKETRIECSDMLVSFDVKSLFTSIPVEDACKILEEKLLADEELVNRSELTPKQITELTRTCLKTTFFKQNGKFFQQTEGASMGSPLSPVIANMYMETLEEKSIQTSELKPKLWLRYVDDILVIWSHGEDTLDDFLEHLNTQNDAIKFTMEKENERELAFLDVKIKRETNSFSFKIHRKSTHSDLYLQWNSNHSTTSKMSVVRSLVDRAFRICSPEYLEEELNHINRVLKKNGFPAKTIYRYIAKKRKGVEPNHHLSDKQENEQTTDDRTARQDRKPRAVLPYIEGLTQNLKRLLEKNNIECAVSSRSQTLKSKLSSVKDKELPEEKACVYQIPCHCGKVYIGQTRRKLTTRVKEHQRDIRNSNHNGSAFVDHLFEPGDHAPLWNKATVLENENNLTKRLTKEALRIHTKRNVAINRMDGAAFSALWDKCWKNNAR